MVDDAEKRRSMVGTLLGLAVSSEATRDTGAALGYLHSARVLLDAWERRLRAHQEPGASQTAPPFVPRNPRPPRYL